MWIKRGRAKKRRKENFISLEKGLYNGLYNTVIGVWCGCVYERETEREDDAEIITKTLMAILE